MSEPAELQAEIDRIERKAQEAGDDSGEVLGVLEEAVQLQQPYEAWRATVRKLVEKALLAGVRPHDLYGKPFTAAHVRMIYNQLREEGADLPKLALGPPRRRRRET